MYIKAVKIDSFTNQIYSIVSIIMSYTHIDTSGPSERLKHLGTQHCGIFIS